jgi:hypothetical protein
MNEFDQIQADLRQVDRFASDFDAAVRAAARQRHERDRSFIVKAVVGLYMVSVGLIVLYLLYRGAWYGEVVFSDAAEIVKVSILPVLTLVIGYYFGTKAQ